MMNNGLVLLIVTAQAIIILAVQPKHQFINFEKPKQNIQASQDGV
jgi:hypothetical protein